MISCMALSQCTSALLKYGCLNSFWDINERGSYSFPPPAELHSFKLVLLIIIMLQCVYITSRSSFFDDNLGDHWNECIKKKQYVKFLKITSINVMAVILYLHEKRPMGSTPYINWTMTGDIQSITVAVIDTKRVCTQVNYTYSI